MKMGLLSQLEKNVVDFKYKNLISNDARLLHQIEASTYEEAMEQHHIKMKWEPYIPLDEIAT
jgi:hypothetical protein